MGSYLSSYQKSRDFALGATRFLAIQALQAEFLFQGYRCTPEPQIPSSIREETIEAILRQHATPGENHTYCKFTPEVLFGQEIRATFSRINGAVEASCDFDGMAFQGFGPTPCFALFSMLAYILSQRKTIPGFPMLSKVTTNAIASSFCQEESFVFNMVSSTRFGTGKYAVVTKKRGAVYKAFLGEKQ